MTPNPCNIRAKRQTKKFPWWNISISQPTNKGILNKRRQFLRPILLLTNPETSALTSCPRTDTLAIHDLSASENVFVTSRHVWNIVYYYLLRRKVISSAACLQSSTTLRGRGCHSSPRRCTSPSTSLSPSSPSRGRALWPPVWYSL